MFKTLAIGLLPLVALAANWIPGACPDLDSDVDSFNPKNMAGLWFEYVWTEGF